MLIASIPGNSVDEAHHGWIDVFSLTQSFDASVKSSACGAAISKGFDKAGPPLWLAAVTGQRLGDVRIEVIRPGERRTKFYELKILNARISAINSEPSILAESLQLVGDGATLTYYENDPVTGNSVATPPANITCK
jgi:type VI secretion system Hcp family effector